MSLSTNGPITATSTGLLAVRTSFVQPSDCKTQWKTTSVAAEEDGTTTMIPVMISDPAATCYPSGWDQVIPESRLSFSPGVCPKGWVYYAVAEATPPVATTAFCCNSGFSKGGFDGSYLVESLVANPCGKYARKVEDDPKDYTDGTNEGKTVMVHQGWAITWAKSDTATLTPQLPTVTDPIRLPIWTPGQKVDLDQLTCQCNDFFPHDLYWFLVVGVPVLFILSVSSCVWCCVRKCRRKRKERRSNVVHMSAIDSR